MEDDTATARTLLATLANDPDPHTQTAWSAPARQTATAIREHLINATQHRHTTVTFTELHRWRRDLDTTLDHLATTDPALWRHWQYPGTWLDSLLRLRSLIAHVLAKAYWNETDQVAYAEMDIPRYLWGAR
ncbi:hypothetical protein SAMN04487905_12036 [Actinopolyspora xinjiangensis]|uniref:Uncharacterized protein n=1 Tax=Actinopolyspora xinjiangensis TaxID=405564 RepID=A0A1H0X0G7_9ACTN|nr:hypothetical protein [Actinopolyspora xinjiangensis]SDP96451.1 hypothetical protein SAMN04487905_12036 [Actinopolyspora xinjiangensis]